MIAIENLQITVGIACLSLVNDQKHTIKKCKNAIVCCVIGQTSRHTEDIHNHKQLIINCLI